MRCLIVVAGLLGLSACAGPTGPIVGDWRGAEPGRDRFYTRVTELILDGTPQQTGGTYHMVSTSNGDGIIGEGRFVDWSGQWQSHVVTDGSGLGYTVYHLDHPPSDHLPDYVRLPDGALLPAIHPEHPDRSPDALRFALLPLPRTAFAYGRP